MVQYIVINDDINPVDHIVTLSSSMSVDDKNISIIFDNINHHDDDDDVITKTINDIGIKLQWNNTNSNKRRTCNEWISLQRVSRSNDKYIDVVRILKDINDTTDCNSSNNDDDGNNANKLLPILPKYKKQLLKYFIDNCDDNDNDDGDSHIYIFVSNSNDSTNDSTNDNDNTNDNTNVMIVLDLLLRNKTHNDIDIIDNVIRTSTTHTTTTTTTTTEETDDDYYDDDDNDGNGNGKGHYDYENDNNDNDDASTITAISKKLNLTLSDSIVTFLIRLIGAVRRDIFGPKNITSDNTINNKIFKLLINNKVGASNISNNDNTTCKEISATGLHIFEFFSGIGGMRCSLPDNLKVATITAFDVSDTPNNVYSENFESSINNIDSYRGSLRRILVDGLKISDVDGQADVWTMSPPCQPFTETRNANRLDDKDNRSKGFFHLMFLLICMNKRPKYIVLENVKGFLDSKVLNIWKRVLIWCGYTYRQYLLSPITSLGIPNHRNRYYMIIEHGERFREEMNSNKVHTSLGIDVKEVIPISNYILTNISYNNDKELYVARTILEKPWAPKRLSIVGDFDRTSFCFTKSYGHTTDKSAGSYYLENAQGPLSDSSFIDRTELGLLFGRIRLFHPQELKKLFGFPESFKFPESMSKRQQYSCIGNSISVSVVREVMKELFIA